MSTTFILANAIDTVEYKDNKGRRNACPFEILYPESRWVPSQEELGRKAYDQLLPPLVHKIRQRVKEWRDSNYQGASETSKALLNYWFNIKHLRHQGQS